MDKGFLPLVNACLNGMTTVFLVAGFFFVKRGKIDAHRKAMSIASVLSILFLISYVIHKCIFHFHTKFQEEGVIRGIYFFILLTHTLLAIVNLPLIVAALTQAFRGKIESHRKIVKWTWPVWMYVSVTGVIVYLMLYQWFPGSE